MKPDHVTAEELREFEGRDIMFELSTARRAISTKTDIGDGNMAPVVWTVPEQVTGKLVSVNHNCARVRVGPALRILPLGIICGATIFSQLELATNMPGGVSPILQ